MPTRISTCEVYDVSMSKNPESTSESLRERLGLAVRLAAFGVPTLGAAAVGGFYGYIGGESLSPEAQTALGEIWEHAVEVAPTVGGVVIGGVLGLVAVIRIADGDFA